MPRKAATKTAAAKPAKAANWPTARDRKLVESMAFCGWTQEQIAAAMDPPISKHVLVKNFRAELEVGKTKILTKVAESLYQKALRGDVGACCFLLKTKAGWREKGPVDEGSQKKSLADLFRDV